MLEEAKTTPSRLKCPRCGSDAIRRSMPRTAFERLVRAWTPYHYFMCRACDYRGMRFGPISSPSAIERGEASLPSRPIEVRDREAGRRRLRQAVTSLLIATALGAASGVYLHGCRQKAELATPPSAE